MLKKLRLERFKSFKEAELTLGPLRPGASDDLRADPPNEVASALRLLTDELEVISENGADALRLLMRDQRTRPSPAVEAEA